MFDLGEKYIFHVHTKRCGHASEDCDEAYVKSYRAWFTKYYFY